MTDLEKFWPKVSYDNDFYKFCFSFGVLLVVSTSIIPFLGVKYMLDESRSYQFTYSPEVLSKAGWSTDSIDSYQKSYFLFLDYLIENLPKWTTMLNIALDVGLLLIAYGFFKWRERQKVKDEIENEFLKKLKLRNKGFDV